jgi:hypothetical protein
MPSRHFQNQDGATLVLVLMFISVFGLIIAALLTEAGASVKYTTTVTNHEEKVYAADAGVQLGIQQLQQHNQICPVTGSNQTIQTTTVNGMPISVTCETTSGSTTGGLGYAIFTRSPDADSLNLLQGGAKKVNGPVHITGGISNLHKKLFVTNGYFSQAESLQPYSCNGVSDPDVEDSGVDVDPGYPMLCKTVTPTAPSYPAPTAVPPTPVSTPLESLDGDCKIFYPGTYENAPAIDPSGDVVNYFATGVYYFKAPFTFAGAGSGDTFFFGGQPAAYELPVKFPDDHPTCASDGEATAAASAASPPVTFSPSGSGVQFIFGDGATLTIADKSRAELFERTANGEQETSSPSVVAVPTTWDPVEWQANTPHSTVLEFTAGADKALIVHGVTYAPDHNVVFRVTEDVDAAVFGGVVAWKLDLRSSNAGDGDGLIISASNGTPAPRHIVVRATAPFPASASAGREVVSTAVVQITNDTPKKVTIESWRTRGPSDPS